MLLFAIVIALAVYLLWHRRHYYKLSWQLPGPIWLPIIGNAFSIAHPRSELFIPEQKKSKLEYYSIISDLIPYLDSATLKYVSPMRLWLGPEMVVFVSDAENVEIVLKSKDCLNKPNSFYKIIRDAMQVDGLFTLKGN